MNKKEDGIDMPATTLLTIPHYEEVLDETCLEETVFY